MRCARINVVARNAASLWPGVYALPLAEDSGRLRNSGKTG